MQKLIFDHVNVYDSHEDNFDNLESEFLSDNESLVRIIKHRYFRLC